VLINAEDYAGYEEYLRYKLSKEEQTKKEDTQ
jgi:hypothetical protein